MKILLVDDNVRFAAALATALRRVGYEVDHAPDARTALGEVGYDLVLLDLGLPDQDGMEVCTKLHRRGDAAIIVLSGRSDESSRIAGLRAGADDYLPKPFGFAELQARIEAVLRRVRPRPAGVLEVGDLTVDLDRREAVHRGELIDLTRKEFDLLAILATTLGTVQRRERLYLEVWNTCWRGTSRTLDVHMATLRSKVAHCVKVETVRGVGYRLAAAEAYALSAIA
jgi:DNA-binding response OmpR family regulator